MRAVMYAACVLLFSSQVWAAIDAYEFKSEEDLKRYERLTYELRCPKCQNNNLRDSNAPIAKDLRREIHRMINEGKTDDEIILFMVERYGNFVLYRPPVNESTWIIWFGPAVALLLGVAGVWWVARRRSAAAGPGAAGDDLTEDEKQRLEALLGSGQASKETDK
ncbi:MAG: cytochrome c-type biogenesis protein CcmH [Gammaproteobacteria bacterium]|nr:MAG: cytochrome c-type biogenesis protein CcmH [Gammaproteobacteria bacterium]